MLPGRLVRIPHRGGEAILRLDLTRRPLGPKLLLDALCLRVRTFCSGLGL